MSQRTDYAFKVAGERHRDLLRRLGDDTNGAERSGVTAMNNNKPPPDYEDELWDLHYDIRGIARELSEAYRSGQRPVTACMAQALWRCVDKLDGIAEHFVSAEHKRYGGEM